jgi:hypothetical protein
MQPTPTNSLKEPICAIGGLSGRFFKPGGQPELGSRIFVSGGGLPGGNAQSYFMNTDGFSASPLGHCFDLGVDRKINQTTQSLQTTYSLLVANDTHTHTTEMAPIDNSFCYFSLIQANEDHFPTNTGEQGVGAHILINGAGRYVLSSCPNNTVNGSVCSPGGLGGNSQSIRMIEAKCISLPVFTQ